MNTISHDHHQQDHLSDYKNLANLIYLLQALAFLFGGITFLFAAVIGYLNKEHFKDSWLESHYHWQLNTFWVALVLALMAAATLPFLGGFIVLMATIIWVIHRIAYGWIRLNKSLPIVRGKKLPLI